MAFFSPEKLKRKSIEIDHSEISSLSPEVQKRLERIEGNYQELEAILAELESKMASDDRLKAIDQSSAEDFEATFGVKRKRKWRTPKPKSKRRKSKKRATSLKAGKVTAKSADPKKPR